MLKTIKTTKEMRLDELIKHVWDNDIKTDMKFRSNEGVSIRFVDDGKTITSWVVGKEDTFTVEVEENITLQTRLNKSVVVYKSNADGELKAGVRNKISLGEILNGYSNSKVLSVYVLIGVEMKLIWERDSND